MNVEQKITFNVLQKKRCRPMMLFQEGRVHKCLIKSPYIIQSVNISNEMSSDFVFARKWMAIAIRNCTRIQNKTGQFKVIQPYLPHGTIMRGALNFVRAQTQLLH